ncbi:MAG: DNA translocase FtsK 4TM domain-containing protein, partial [Arenicella sp.]|nr:DNA translocase FtsK 4TM domain-containing protein [Arenicella sp.]
MPQAKKKTVKQQDGILSPRVKQLGSEIVVFFSVFVALYALLSLLTYDPADPGWSHSGGGAQSISNMGGRFGANFSDMLLHGFGYVSYLVPIMILVLGLRFYSHRHDASEPSYFHRVLIAVGFLITVVGGCGL